MAETPWTKGPWAVSDLPGGSLCVDATVDLPDGGKIGRVICQWDYWHTHIEDARLIAAAPDLYEALEAMVETFNAYQGSEITHARAALARARGDE